MDYLSYKTYVWPQNPSTYQETNTREAQYSSDEGVILFDGMGPVKQVITGSGVFFGKDAVKWYQELEKIFADDTAGDLRHPVWGIRHCYFTKLELTQEPKDNCISYRFEFTGAHPDGGIPK